MRKVLFVSAVIAAGLLAGCAQPGYGPAYGYGSPGYGPQYAGYGQQFAQPAPNPMVQLIGSLLGAGGGFNQSYYQPAPYYGQGYGYR